MHQAPDDLHKIQQSENDLETIILRSHHLWIPVLFSVFTGRRLRLVFSRVMLVPLGLQPALWEDQLLGPVGGGAQQGFDVIVVHHLSFQQRVGHLERRTTNKLRFITTEHKAVAQKCSMMKIAMF